jgi:hypothetical protein
MEEFIAIQAIENEDLAQIIMIAQAQRRVYPNLDPFEILNERMLIKIFRLSIELLRELMRMLDDFLDAPTRSPAISNQTRILIVLNFFANGSYQNSVACT